MADDEDVSEWEYKGKDAVFHGPQCGVRGDVLHDDVLEECNLLALVPCHPPKMHVVVPERQEQAVLGNVLGTRYMLSGIHTFRVTASRLAPAPPAPSSGAASSSVFAGEPLALVSTAAVSTAPISTATVPTASVSAASVSAALDSTIAVSAALVSTAAISTASISAAAISALESISFRSELDTYEHDARTPPLRFRQV